jgi:large subunit ribosomal protein L11
MPKLKTTIKLNIEAGKANPAPPVGPALGSHGVKIIEFCTQFNAQTKGMEGIVPALIDIYDDGSFKFVLKTPPVSSLVTKALKVAKGSGVPNKDKIGELTKEQIREIAEIKMPDLNTISVEQAMKIIEGTARSMGAKIKN